MPTYDVHVEFVNGQETWITLNAPSRRTAEEMAIVEYGENVCEATGHEHGTRPGHKRQGR